MMDDPLLAMGFQPFCDFAEVTCLQTLPRKRGSKGVQNTVKGGRVRKGERECKRPGAMGVEGQEKRVF